MSCHAAQAEEEVSVTRRVWTRAAIGSPLGCCHYQSAVPQGPASGKVCFHPTAVLWLCLEVSVHSDLLQ